MNPSEYAELCRACDDLIDSPDASIDRVAIQWLHVIREHPVFLKQYEFLFDEDEPFLREMWRRLGAKWNAWLWSLRQLRRTFLSQKSYQEQLESLPPEVDFLFVSHYVNASQADGLALDFYFGDLPSTLAAQGATVVVALINQTRRECLVSIKPISAGRIARILLPLSLDQAEERSVLALLKTGSRRLDSDADSKSGLAAKVARWASLEALGGASRTAMRTGRQIAALAKRLDAKNLVYTFEGHAWERVACALARDAVPSIKCIAYQHAALFERQHAIRRNLAARYNPDVIWASNEFAKSEFETLMPSVRVVELGSPRGLGERRYRESRPSRSERICLVLPEGIESECNILFEFSKRCALIFPDIHFIWRLHPLMSMKRLRLRNPVLWSLPSNVTISKRSLEEDADAANWALYRGTTAVASAIVAGARPVYLHREGEIPFDPLFRTGGFRAVVKNPVDLAEVFTEDTVCPEEAATACALCRALFPPMRAAEVAEWLATRAADPAVLDNLVSA